MVKITNNKIFVVIRKIDQSHKYDPPKFGQNFIEHVSIYPTIKDTTLKKKLSTFGIYIKMFFRTSDSGIKQSVGIPGLKV